MSGMPHAGLVLNLLLFSQWFLSKYCICGCQSKARARSHYDVWWNIVPEDLIALIDTMQQSARLPGKLTAVGSLGQFLGNQDE